MQIAAKTLRLPGHIWRILPSADGTALAIELRQAHQQAAWFAVVVLPSLALQFPPQPMPAGGWAFLAALQEGVVLLQGLHAPSMPLARGIFAYAARTGEQLWAAPDAVFQAELPGQVLASPYADPPSSARHLLSLQHGTLSQSFAADDPALLSLLQAQPATQPIDNQVYKLLETDTAFGQLATEIQTKLAGAPTRQIDLWQHPGGLSGVGWLEAQGGSGAKPNYHLALIKAAQALWRTTLPAQPGAGFMVVGSLLLFLPETTDIACINLSPFL